MTTWPMILDMSRDECKRMLRRLELEAYSSLVSVLRAQGGLSKDKRRLLQDLAATLNISMERHRAEVRRAVNDEKLATIAEHIAGPNTAPDWAIEGRRLVPLMPRLVPQTAFTALANNVASMAAGENAKLPPPGNTVKKNVSEDAAPPCEPSVPEASKTPQRCISPSAAQEEEEERCRKRHRSSSSERQPPSPTLPPPKVPNIPSQSQTSGRTVTFPMGMITPGRTPVVTTTSSTTQKVIIVSSSTASGSPSILQRSLSVPIVKTVSTTSSSSTLSQQPRTASLIINSQSTSGATTPHASTGNIVTISTNPGNGGSLTATTVSIGGIPTTAYITSQSGVPKIRPKSVQLPAKPRPRSGSIVIPVTPNQLTGGPAQLKTSLHSVKPSLHIKQDPAGMKIMPISSVSSATKILPKPAFCSGSQAPMYMMSATTASVPMVTRTVATSSAPRVVTLNTTSASTPGIRPAGTATFIAKNSPKPIQTVQIASQGNSVTKPSGGKPNVIVVQKGSVAGFSRGVTLSHAGKEVVGKVIMSKSLTSSSMPASTLTTVTVQKPGVSPQTVSTAQGNLLVVDLSQEQLSKNSVLAEILQASGILTDGGNSSSENTSSSNDASCKAAAAPSDWVSMDTASSEVEISELVDEESAIQKEVDMPAGRVVTLEEAVEMLGHSDSPETRALLSQAGIQVTDSSPAQNSGKMQEVGDAGGHEMMEVIGELDPQTGIYSVHQPSASEPGRIVTTSTPDIFTTALASADINLDTFQYAEEEPSENTASTEVTEAGGDVLQYNQPPGSVEPKQEHVSSFLQSGSGDSTAVTVEPSNMDTTGMHIEDFTSQKVQGQDIT